MITLLSVLYLGALVALGIFLGWRYSQTRNIGYILLMFALPLWPFLSGVSESFLRSQAELLLDGAEPAFPVSLFDARFTVGETLAVFSYLAKLLHTSLILVGVFLMGRSFRAPQPVAHS